MLPETTSIPLTPLKIVKARMKEAHAVALERRQCRRTLWLNISEVLLILKHLHDWWLLYYFNQPIGPWLLGLQGNHLFRLAPPKKNAQTKQQKPKKKEIYEFPFRITLRFWCFFGPA